MRQYWFAVQRYLDQVHVARQCGDVPRPRPGQALVQMMACGICGADIRAVTGNKTTSGDPDQYTILGHEGMGRVIAVKDDATELAVGDYVAVLPHVLDTSHSAEAAQGQIEPVDIGSGRTLHMGWDLDGCFADFTVMPTSNLVRIPLAQLQRARQLAPRLREAVFALVEPMLCTLSAYRLIEDQFRTLLGRACPAGRALVIGCGPIGVLHSLVLLAHGFEVWLTDVLPKRTLLTQWCLEGRVHTLDSEQPHDAFDLVMVAASSAQAVRLGEKLVRNGGIVYLFAGLNAADYAAMDAENVFFYERLHRTAKGVLTTTRLIGKDKSIFYLGHSGYFEALSSEAVISVAAHAAALDRSITGIIRGWSSPRIESRLPGSVDWATEDGSPAIIPVLQGVDLRARHIKLLVLPDQEKTETRPNGSMDVKK